MTKNIVIAGAAGQGLKTLNDIITKVLFKTGLNVYSTKDYMSRIRGGHNFMSIRVSDKEVSSSSNTIDILIALNKQSIMNHKEDLANEHIVFFDGNFDSDGDQSTGINITSIPAKEIGKSLGHNKIWNMVFIGSTLKSLGLTFEVAQPIVEDNLKFDDALKDKNIQALKKGFSLVESHFPMPIPGHKESQYLINGNDAVGLGAAIGGVQFYSAYPMTPSTGIMNYLAKHSNELNIVVEQAEDEIAAINMALGASYGGIRAMTGTSGGGFGLMNETLGFASVAELPIVIANVQRPGPATGMPTRTGQGDLNFIINSSTDEFPLVVIAPRSADDAFLQTFKAMNWAEKYQMPFIILTDQYLADTKTNFKTHDIDLLKNENYYFNDKQPSTIDDFKRYEITENGISNLAYPGQFKNTYVFADSHEHTEYGHITEDSDMRIQMVDKRARKLQTFVDNDMLEPIYHGPKDPKYIILSWGSTYGPAKEAIQQLEHVGLLSFNHVWPLPEKLLKKYAANAEFISVENNSYGQLAKLIQQEFCLPIDYKLLKYDGRPFTGDEIANRIAKEVM